MASETRPPLRYGESFGQIVRRQFFKRKAAVAGLAIVLVFFLVAAFAPFLAGNVPLLFRHDGKLHSPVLAYATREDVLWWGHVFAVAATAIAGLLWRKRFPPGSPERFRYLLAVLFLGVGLTYLAGFARSTRLDTTDWKAMANEFRAGDLAVFPPIRFGPYEYSLADRLHAPDRIHYLGTDISGRDVLTRLIHGTRISLIVGFFSVTIALAIGLTIGSCAGYFGGWVDAVLLRVIEIFMCFPTFFFILIILAFLPPSIWNVMVAIGLFGWTGVARFTRGEFFRLKGQDFVTAAQALGVPEFRIIFRHVLPNALTPALVSATFGIAGAILTESGLSFLGFGTPPPTPSWGALLAGGQQYIDTAWWLAIFPGVAIFVAVLSYNLVGEGLRDAIDPRLRR